VSEIAILPLPALPLPLVDSALTNLLHSLVLLPLRSDREAGHRNIVRHHSSCVEMLCMEVSRLFDLMSCLLGES